MTKEDYISFETAKLLKEKGFAEPTCGFYWAGTLFISTPSNHNGSINAVAAPSHGHAMKWLREVHDKNIILDMVSLNEDCYVLWTYNVYCSKNYKIIWGPKQPKYNTYEEACEEAIKYCLENLI